MKKLFMLSIVSILFFSTTASFGSLTCVVDYNNYVEKKLCPHGTPGNTTVQPVQWVSAGQLTAPQLAGQYTGNWNYQVVDDQNVSGLITITKYKAHDDPGVCQHGANLAAVLTGVSGLPAGEKFAWLQTYTEFGDNGNDTGKGDPASNEIIPVLDENGNKIGEEISDDMPFYNDWLDGQVWTFWDWPSISIADEDVIHSGGVTFTTMVTSWQGWYDAIGVNNVRIYGAFTWGYNYICTPEPTTLILFCFGGLALLRKHRA